MKQTISICKRNANRLSFKIFAWNNIVICQSILNHVFIYIFQCRNRLWLCCIVEIWNRFVILRLNIEKCVCIKNLFAQHSRAIVATKMQNKILKFCCFKNSFMFFEKSSSIFLSWSIFWTWKNTNSIRFRTTNSMCFWYRKHFSQQSSIDSKWSNISFSFMKTYWHWFNFVNALQILRSLNRQRITFLQ